MKRKSKIHTDLFTAKDMYFETNSQKCQFVEERDWKYEKHFTVEQLGEHPILVFEGLDTYCDIYLNGEKIGSADNMFIPHKFSVNGILKQGKWSDPTEFFLSWDIITATEE